MNIKAGIVSNIVSLSQGDIIAYDTPDGVFYHIGCLVDAVSFASNDCRYLRLEISSPPLSSPTVPSSGLTGLSSRINALRTGTNDVIGSTILTKYLYVDQIFSNSAYSSLKIGKPISYRFYVADSQGQSSSIDTKSSLSLLAKSNLVSGVDPSLLFGNVPVTSRPRILSTAPFLTNQSGSISYVPQPSSPIIITESGTSQFTTYTQNYALSNHLMIYFDVSQDEILGASLSKTVRFEVSALDAESSPISFSQKIQLTIPGNDVNLRDPNVMNSSVSSLRRRIVSFDAPDLAVYETPPASTSTSVLEPYVLRNVGYVSSDSTVVVSSPPDVSSRTVVNPEKIVQSQSTSTSFPFYITNADQQDTWKINFEKLPDRVESIKISLRRPGQPSCLKYQHQIIRTQGEKSLYLSTAGLSSGQDYIVNVSFEDSRLGKIEAANEILWTYKKKSGWASLNTVTVTRATVFDDINRTFVTQANIKANVTDDNTAWSDFNNSLAQSGVSLTDSASNRFAKVFRAQSIDLFTGEQQFISEGLPLDSFLGSGVNLVLPNTNPHVIIIEVGIIDNEGVYFAGTTSDSSLSGASIYAFNNRIASTSGNFGLSFSRYYTGVSVIALDTTSVDYGITNFTVDQTRSPNYDVIQWSINSSNSSSPIDHFQVVATLDGTSYLLGCVPFRPSSLTYRFIERNLSGIIGRISYTVNPILTNMQSSSPSTLSRTIESGLLKINSNVILSQDVVDDSYETEVRPNIAFEKVVNAIQ